MANDFIDIPVPVTNTAGAAVDVSTLGKTKTLIIGGGFRATVNVQYAVDAAGTIWAPLATFQKAGNLTVDIACMWIRAVTSNFVSGVPNLDVGGDATATTSVELTDDGASVDISSLPDFKTVVVPYGFVGSVDISEDGSVWTQAFSFAAAQPNAQSRVIIGQFARCVGTVDGVAAGCYIAGANASGGGGSSAATTEMVAVLYRSTALAVPAASDKVEVMATELATITSDEAYFVTAQATFTCTTTDDAFAGAVFALSIWWFNGESEELLGYAESAWSKQQNKVIHANLVVNAVLPGPVIGPGPGELRMYASTSGSDGTNLGLAVQDGQPGPCMSIMRIPASVVVDAG